MELLLQPPKPIEDRFRPDAEIVLFHGDVSEFLAQIPDSVLTEEELIYILEVQIPDLLDRRPELQWRIYSAFLDLFARREEIAAIYGGIAQSP